MRFALLSACVAALVAVLGGLHFLSVGPAPAPVPVAVPVPAPTVGISQPRTSSSSIAFAPDHWRARADLVSERCHVETHTLCSATSCASVAWLPDLDSVRGWASLGWHNPGVFATSLLGEVGLEPPGGWPCQDAVRSFHTGVMNVRIGDGPRGTWVVCTAAAADSAAMDEACVAAAAALGLPWRFTDPARQL